MSLSLGDRILFAQWALGLLFEAPQSPREAAIVKRINALLSGEGSPVGKWIAVAKQEGASFELAVVRDDNDLGKLFCGRFDENKWLVSSGQLSAVRGEDWSLLVALAQNIADEMNKKEGTE